MTLHGTGLGGWMNMEKFITGFPVNQNAFRQVVYRCLGHACLCDFHRTVSGRSGEWVSSAMQSEALNEEPFEPHRTSRSR